MKIWDAETFELKHMFEQEFITRQLTITADSNYDVSPTTTRHLELLSIRKYHLAESTPSRA